MPPKRSSDGAKKSPAAKSPAKSSANGDAAEAAEELLQNVPAKKKPKKAASKLSKGTGKRVMTKKGDIFHSISAKQQETVLTRCNFSERLFRAVVQVTSSWSLISSL